MKKSTTQRKAAMQLFFPSFRRLSTAEGLVKPEYREGLNKFLASFPRKREFIFLGTKSTMDSRFRGNDDLLRGS